MSDLNNVPGTSGINSEMTEIKDDSQVQMDYDFEYEEVTRPYFDKKQKNKKAKNEKKPKHDLNQRKNVIVSLFLDLLKFSKY